MIKNKNGKIKTISDEGKDSTIFPRIDFYLNGCPKDRSEDQFGVAKWLEGKKVKINFISIYNYEKDY